jgi:hypothetical protein
VRRMLEAVGLARREAAPHGDGPDCTRQLAGRRRATAHARTSFLRSKRRGQLIRSRSARCAQRNRASCARNRHELRSSPANEILTCVSVSDR